MPVSSRYHGAQVHAQLGGEFFDVVSPASFPHLVLRFRNQRHAATVGLDGLSDEEWQAHFGAFEPLPDSFPKPLALRYHGHQFGVYNPDLGDGRGFLFAQMRELDTNRLLDLGTKGSGQTPWSRAGDGRLTLKGGVREVLASEMLEALGVETSKTFSLFETGESLTRYDEPSPTRAAVLVRLSHSHIRIGTFQRLAFEQQPDLIEKLVHHLVTYYFPAIQGHATPALALFEAAIDNVARMGAQYFAAGFVHGVLNTDNVTLLGESFDYGPWRFLPLYHPPFTAAYFDENGRYAFGRQPEALLWALARLAETLLPFVSHADLKQALEKFLTRFKMNLTRQTLSLLGLDLPQEQAHTAQETVSALYVAMRETQAPFAQTLFDLFGGGIEARLERSPHAALYQTEMMQQVIKSLRDLPTHPNYAVAKDHAYFSAANPSDLLIEEVEALWGPIAERDDWSQFEAKIESIRMKGAAYAPILAKSPQPTSTVA